MCYIIIRDTLQNEKYFLKWSDSVKIAGKHSLDYSRFKRCVLKEYSLVLCLVPCDVRMIYIPNVACLSPEHPNRTSGFVGEKKLVNSVTYKLRGILVEAGKQECVDYILGIIVRPYIYANEMLCGGWPQDLTRLFS